MADTDNGQRVRGPAQPALQGRAGDHSRAHRIDGPNGAARLLELNPSTLRSRMKKLGIRRSDDSW